MSQYTMFLTGIALAFLALSTAYFIAGVKALKNRKALTGVSHTAVASLFLALSLVLMLGFVCLRGYHAFNYEALVAKVWLTPVKEGTFEAHFEFPDGASKDLTIYGNELVVDAYILKWKPLANFIGIHTSYQLARVSGRYQDYDDEIAKPRSVFRLNQQNAYDLFKLRKEFSALTFLVDAEYGSASFVPAKKTQYALMISNTGLLFRPTE